MAESLIPKHGGYRKLKSFQVAELVYDVTVRFCDKYKVFQEEGGFTERLYRERSCYRKFGDR